MSRVACGTVRGRVRSRTARWAAARLGVRYPSESGCRQRAVKTPACAARSNPKFSAGRAAVSRTPSVDLRLRELLCRPRDRACHCGSRCAARVAFVEQPLGTEWVPASLSLERDDEGHRVTAIGVGVTAR
jgi:hypothetical protein